MRIGENHPAKGARAPVDRHDWAKAAYRLGAHAAAGAGGAWTFALYSKHAQRVLLELYDQSLAGVAACDYWLERGKDDVWRAKIAGVAPGTFYGFRCWGPNFAWDEAWSRGNSAAGSRADVDGDGNRFNPNKLLIDPYARELSHDRETPAMVAAGHNGAMYLSGPRQYAGAASREFDTGPWAPKSITVVEEAAAADGRPTFRQRDGIIYEVHPRGLTQHPSSSELASLLRGVPGFEGVASVPEDERGTYAGAGRMAPYLKALGVNTVELLPVHECNNDLNSADTSDHPDDREPHGNYWGYMTYGFFAPDRRYAKDRSPGGPTREFREMVRSFHARGIKVYLDVVYNHYAEMGVTREQVNGAPVDFPDVAEVVGLRGIDNGEYYALADGNRNYWQSTGCGNNLDASKAPVRKLILDSLEYWAGLGVDGFRFDLAPVLGRTGGDHGFEGTDLLKEIAQLAGRRKFDVVAEPWDCNGAFTGYFPEGWAEWNDHYRDAVRDFLKGTGDLHRFMDAVNGSYAEFGDEGGPQKSVNLVTAHDGFTLMDLVSYDAKSNKQRWPFGPCDGGADDNHAWSSNGDHALRRQRMRNFLAVQFFSRGVPLLVGGDEFARTQNGNNNPYKLDNAAMWSNYRMIATHAPTRVPIQDGAMAAAYHDNYGEDAGRGPTSAHFAFLRYLAAARAAHASLRQDKYADAVLDQGKDVTYLFKKEDGRSDLQGWERCVHLHIDGSQVKDSDFLVLVNMHENAVDFAVPAAASGKCWRRIVDTAAWAEPEGNCWEVASAARIDGRYGVNARSVVVLQER
jgi:glycogen operon protein